MTPPRSPTLVSDMRVDAKSSDFVTGTVPILKSTGADSTVRHAKVHLILNTRRVAVFAVVIRGILLLYVATARHPHCRHWPAFCPPARMPRSGGVSDTIQHRPNAMVTNRTTTVDEPSCQAGGLLALRHAATGGRRRDYRHISERCRFSAAQVQENISHHAKHLFLPSMQPQPEVATPVRLTLN